MNILVTGGTGYDGSLTCTELLKADRKTAIFGNFWKNFSAAARHIIKIAKQLFIATKGDILNRMASEQALRPCQGHGIVRWSTSVSTALSESIEKPAKHRDHHVPSALRLRFMRTTRSVSTSACSDDTLDETGIPNYIHVSGLEIGYFKHRRVTEPVILL